MTTKKSTSSRSDDWRASMLETVRELIQEAASGATEEQKWKKASNPNGVPVWSESGIICTGEIYRDKVKLTFAKGAALESSTNLFNASLTGNMRRAIDIYENDTLNRAAFKKLIKTAVALNRK